MSHERPSLSEALRDALPVHAAPESLRAFARQRVAPDARTVPRISAWRQRTALTAGLLLTLAAGWNVRGLWDHRESARSADAMVVAVVDAHVRSLAGGHVTEVQSSDRHTVKPWFAGKVDLAPNVPELASSGFPLLGGRVEMVSGHTAAALVYGRRRHVIDLFIWTTTSANSHPSLSSYHGFAVTSWSADGLSYWAVSDVAATDLREFTDRYRGIFPGKGYP